jgi:hypothetical protein
MGVLLLFSCRWISQLQFTQFVVSPDKSLQASDRGFSREAVTPLSELLRQPAALTAELE